MGRDSLLDMAKSEKAGSVFLLSVNTVRIFVPVYIWH